MIVVYYKSIYQQYNSIMSNNTLTMEQEQRRKWIDEYNNSLPQKVINGEFGVMSVAIGGIYDGEAELYEFDNSPSPRILKLLQIQKCPLCITQYPNQIGTICCSCGWCGRKMCSACECDCMLVSGIKCRKCNVYLEPHTQDEHLDINHKVHKCEGGHKR